MVVWCLKPSTVLIFKLTSLSQRLAISCCARTSCSRQALRIFCKAALLWIRSILFCSESFNSSSNSWTGDSSSPLPVTSLLVFPSSYNEWRNAVHELQARLAISCCARTSCSRQAFRIFCKSALLWIRSILFCSESFNSSSNSWTRDSSSPLPVTSSLIFPSSYNEWSNTVHELQAIHALR